MTNIVVVTGAGSLVAGHIVKRLLELGFLVRGTVRNVKDDHAHLHTLSNKHPNRFTLHQVADLANPGEELQQALKGASALIHVANPIGASAAGMSEEEQVRSSVQCVEGIFNAAVQAGSVSRVVVTATMASICGSQRKADPNHLWCENDWNDEPTSQYSKSKTLAEKKLWELASKHNQIGVSTIHPALVLGPLLPDQKPRSTMDMFLPYANGSQVASGASAHMSGICDARDVAEAHVLALMAPGAIGQRYMVTSRATYTSLDICALVHKNFPQIAVPTKFADEKVASWCKGRVDSSDLTKITSFLGRPVLSPDTIIHDTVTSLASVGVLKI